VASPWPVSAARRYQGLVGGICEVVPLGGLGLLRASCHISSGIDVPESGRSGQAQGGLDIVGGPATDRSVYQVRRIAALTPAGLRTAVVDYAGQPSSDLSIRRFGKGDAALQPAGSL
jgi:hypothetical protein